MRLQLGILVVVLLLPVVAAAPAQVTLTSANGTWNGLSEAGVENGTALVWVPQNARIHDVLAWSADGSSGTASWRAEGADALRVSAPPNATSVQVDYDFSGTSLTLARFVAPTHVDRLTFTVRPPGGQRVESQSVAFEDSGDGSYHAELVNVPQGASVRIRVVDADRVGELPLLAALAIVASVTFLAALAWHQLRSPAPRGGATRFLDHLMELQARLVPPIIAFAFLNIFYFVAGLRVIELFGRWPIVIPTLSTNGSLATRAFDAFAERQVPAGVQLVVLRPIDAVLAQVQVALFLAFVTVLPLILYELVAFLGPALKARERRIALRILPVVFGLFLVGSAFGYLTMSPLMIKTLYDFAPSVGATSFLGVGDLVSFSLIVVLSFGLAFELPIVMYALSRFGVVQAKTWRKYVRHAIVIIVVVAGLLTPDPSIVSQMLVAFPVTALYVLGMLAAMWGEKRRGKAGAVGQAAMA
ncbi:MAG: twin-arginine translocase subunit TatC [Candidatus Thermoplasmatota archaeon]